MNIDPGLVMFSVLLRVIRRTVLIRRTCSKMAGCELMLESKRIKRNGREKENSPVDPKRNK